MKYLEDIRDTESVAKSGRYMKINLKFTKDLKCKTWNHKTLKETKGIITFDMGLDKDFWIWHLKHKHQNQKWTKGTTPVKSFFTAKEIINRIIRQPIIWEKIFTTISDKGLYLKYTKNSYNSIAKKKKKRKQSYWENSQKTRWDREYFQRRYTARTGIWRYVQIY